MKNSTLRISSTRSPNAVDVMVGEMIRLLRQQENMTLAELASILGASHQQVQKYETGHNRVSAGKLYRIACVFGVSMNEFFPYNPAKMTQRDRMAVVYNR